MRQPPWPRPTDTAPPAPRRHDSLSLREGVGNRVRSIQSLVYYIWSPPSEKHFLIWERSVWLTCVLQAEKQRLER